MGWLGSILKAAAPVAGFALGGPLGAMAGSALSSGIAGAEKGKQADKYRQKQAAYADSRVAAGAPFRSKLAQLAMRPRAQREDLSGLVSDPGNPYARTASRPTLAAQAFPPPQGPAQSPMTPMGGPMGGMDPRMRRPMLGQGGPFR